MKEKKKTSDLDSKSIAIISVIWKMSTQIEIFHHKKIKGWKFCIDTETNELYNDRVLYER